MKEEKTYEDTHVFLCECHELNHQFVFTDSTDFGNVMLSVHLNPYYGIWQRIKIAFMYIIGKTIPYGAYDCVVVKNTDWPKLQTIVDHMKSHLEKGYSNEG